MITPPRICYHPRSCATCDRLGSSCGNHNTADQGHQRCTGMDILKVPAPKLPRGFQLKCIQCGCSVQPGHQPGYDDCEVARDERDASRAL